MLSRDDFIDKFQDMQEKTVRITQEVGLRIKPGQTERQIADFYAESLAEVGLNEHWYPILVYVGGSTSMPISRRYHLPSDDVVVKENDIVMIDCTPIDGAVWSNWAETFVVGRDDFFQSLVDDSRMIVDLVYDFTSSEAKSVQDIYDFTMSLLERGGFVSLDPKGDVGHSIFQVEPGQTVDKTPIEQRLFIYPDHGERLIEGIISIEPQIGKISPVDGRMYSAKMQKVYIA